MATSNSSKLSPGFKRIGFLKIGALPLTRLGSRLHPIGPRFVIQGQTMAVYECECGAICVVQIGNATHGTTLSCGCLHQERLAMERRTHGFTTGRKEHPIYRLRKAMLDRCYRPGNSRYHRYGGRGIVVCEEWKNNPVAFVDWAKTHGWKPGLTIDRRDNDGNYCPENCRFVTIQVNSRNTSRNHPVTAFGETKLLVEWTEDARCTVNFRTLSGRIRNDWAPEDAIALPSHAGKPYRNRQSPAIIPENLLW